MLCSVLLPIKDWRLAAQLFSSFARDECIHTHYALHYHGTVWPWKTGVLHTGQHTDRPCCLSHSSMQPVWKWCRHGSVFTSCRGTKLSRQMLHNSTSSSAHFPPCQTPQNPSGPRQAPGEEHVYIKKREGPALLECLAQLLLQSCGVTEAALIKAGRQVCSHVHFQEQNGHVLAGPPHQLPSQACAALNCPGRALTASHSLPTGAADGFVSFCQQL